jgi:hypothetical protein
MARPGLALLIALLPLGTALAAPPIGYAQATGYFKKDKRPTLYQPLNLLDGREATAWCTTTSDPLEDVLSFGFKGTVRIDEVRIYTGNGFDEATFKEFSRARKLLLKGPDGAQSLVVADQRGQQAVALNPPMRGTHFTLQVLDQYLVEDPESPVCLTDVVFYSGGKPLNGSWLTQKLKYDRSRAGLLGTWFAGSEGAPDKFLSFYFDGSFRFVHEPWDPAQKGKTITGDYDPRGGRMSLQVPGKGKVNVQLRRGQTNGQQTLVLDGDVPPELKQTFRSQM